MVTELDRHCFWAASLESTVMADQALYIAKVDKVMSECIIWGLSKKCMGMKPCPGASLR